ncbi:MAG: Fe-S cluster assembly protein SufD, partial [Chloroflexi bacterium]|nr:Fe-S cluster assembly protein SufD [Chloroflexota bacterium]
GNSVLQTPPDTNRMTQSTAKYDTYRSAFQSLQSGPWAGDPPWLQSMRQRGWTAFNELGFPTARRGNEKWKYTSVRPLASQPFQVALAHNGTSSVAQSEIQRLGVWNTGWTNLVFLDGRYDAGLSNLPLESSGLRVTNLADAVTSDGDLLERYLTQQATVVDDGFTALNTAFLQDGAFIHVGEGQHAPAPVHLIFVTTNSQQQSVSHPRTLVVAGAGSRITFIESYLNLSGNNSSGNCFTNAVTEMVLDDGAEVEHYRLLHESPESFHVGTIRVYQGQDSTLKSGSFAMGTAMARIDYQVLLDAPGASCSLNGLYMTTDTQHIDNLISIDHAKPHTTSRLLYKGILDGHSRAVFGGTVLVRKDAQKSDARQTDKNLLLSRQAEVDSKPSLLIYADDVQCGHGATAGHIDEDTLFYMKSRGIDHATASRILIQAFAREVIDTVELEPLRDSLDELFLQAIPAERPQLGGGQ